MILYHGSNVEVRRPRVLTTNRSLDFGAGFYTTSNLDDDLKMWHFSPLAVFDMWENEQATGDPRNSLYLRGDEIA